MALASTLPSVILRPSLVLGETSFGGSSLLRALAAFPLASPMVGDGKQAFDPIHVEDLAATVRQAIETDALDGQTISPCGPERVTQAGMISALRAWLGRAPAPALRLPMPMARAMGWLGDRLKLGPISLAAVAQLETGVQRITKPSTRPRAKPRAASPESSPTAPLALKTFGTPASTCCAPSSAFP